MKAVWAKGLSERMNTTVAFTLDLNKKKDISISTVIATCYKIYIDGNFFAFGPQRSAHGYAREMHYNCTARYVTIEVYSPYINGFCWIKQKPFFACELISDGKKYTSKDFKCYFLDDRIQKVQRYSFQRGFIENYRLKKDRSELYAGKGGYQLCETEEVALPKILPSYVDEPKYTVHKPIEEIDSGYVEINKDTPVWRDAMIHGFTDKKIECYKPDEWEESASDEVSKFVYNSSKDVSGKNLTYKTVGFGRGITGFIELDVEARGSGDIYVIFDEILWKEKGKGDYFVSFNRQGWTNVIKWNLECGGKFELSSFEPYTVGYACVVVSEGINVEITVRDYENPNVNEFKYSSEDENVNKIINAAKATLAQNSVDILVDCPSRERAGWLCDSYFSSEAEFVATGKNQAEKTFLENYALADCSDLPKGMVPMCYPSDNYDTFLPNWGIFYIIELEKYAKRYGKTDRIIQMSLKKVDGLINYFGKFENEIGLLENLDGWVFVEWSKAIEKERLQGVHIPTNISYSRALKAAAYLFDDNTYNDKANVVVESIKKYAFDGDFFVDNLIRGEDGKLKQSGLLSEVCQYYAFWFDAISKSEYQRLYSELMNNLGVRRKEGYRNDVAEANVFCGLYMRIDLLMRDGKKKEVLDECVKLFLPMAERTGTLWELNSPNASCNHGFASYVLVWLKYALDK